LSGALAFRFSPSNNLSMQDRISKNIEIKGTSAKIDPITQ
jgi:hypothetical protein